MTNFCIFLLIIFCIGIVTIFADKPSDTLMFINDLQIKLKLPSSRKINLVVGNTGVGKSTYVHYAAGDIKKIFSKKFGRKLKIIDGLDPELNKTTFATESRTLVPEMVIDENGYVWYDCPGFGDTHNETVEIATSFLIKKIIENASYVKIILIIDYEAVTEGYNRDSFDILLSRATQLIKNIERYKNSLSLVITKVPQHDEFGELLDEDVKSSAVDFIRMHRKYLQTKQSSEKKIQLIDIFLGKSSNIDFEKISIFWRPLQAGSFDDNNRMVEGREKTRKSIIQHSLYAEIQKNDFGFPLTGEAQLEVYNITKSTSDNLLNTLHHIVNQTLNEIQLKIEMNTDFDEKLYLIETGKNYFVEIQNRNDNNAITLKQLTEHLKKCIQTFEIETIDMNDFDRIELQDVNLHIFLSLIETKKSTSIDEINYNSFLKKINNHFTIWERFTRENITTEAHRTILNISNVLTNADTEILSLLEKRLQSINLFQNRLHWLQLVKDDINRISGELTLENKIQQFEVLIESLNISSSNFKVLNNLKQFKNDLIYMKRSANTVIIDPIYDWITKSSSSINYLTSQYNWYNFLQKTYNFFASYDVQKDLSAYNVANLSDWGKFHRSQNLFVDIDNFHEFTKKITILNFEPTEMNLSELNDIINVTLKSSIKYEYNDKRTTITIKGNFIKSSDIQPFTTDVSLNQINVFVVDTFYIDCNLTLNPFNEVELNILAHTWDIRQKAIFRLNGANGTYQYPPITHGIAGRHGNPGTNAGNFFGFANNIIDGNLLSVELNGGNGGDGQDGSGSEDYGHQFETVYFSDEDVAFTRDRRRVVNSIIEKYFQKNGYIFHENESGPIWSQIAWTPVIVPVGSDGNRYTKYTIFPKRCCGNTGLGGKGGHGGFQGYYTFIHANNKLEGLSNHTKYDGINGLNGIDGRICRTFQIDVTAYSEWNVRFWDWKVEVEIEKESVSIYSGCSSEYIDSKEELTEPKPKPIKFTYTQSIVKYKEFLIEKMTFKPLLKIIQKTYNAIDSDSEINHAYSPMEFMAEMNALEKKFVLNDRIDMSPMYADLLKRIDEYSKTKANTLSNVDRKLLTQIYSIVLSKKMSMENDQNGDLIVDIDKFFYIIIEYIKKLNKNERIYVINEQKNQYKDEIHEKIQEANDYIKNVIEPETEKIISILNVEMKKTLNETIELQAQQMIRIKQKEEKANEMRKIAMIRKLLSIGKMVINIFSTGYDVLFKQYADDQTSEIARTSQTMSKTSELIEENYHKKVNVMDNELSLLMTFISADSKNDNHFNKRLIDLQTKVKQIKLERSYSKTSILLHECTEFVQKTIENPTNETTPNILQRMKKTSNLFVGIASNYQEYSEDDEKLDQIGMAIKQDMKILMDLMRLEDQIFSDLLPTINEMHAYLQGFEKNLTNKSSIALDIMKWRIHDILRTIQKKFGDAVSGYSNEYDINNCLVRIGETMTLLIDINDRIHGYQEQSQLISYLTRLQLMNHKNIQLPDNIEFIELETNLQRNLILSLYDRALNAFKQAIFPYAAEYLDFYQLPSALVANDSDIKHYTEIVTQKIQSLSEKMQLFNASVINSNDMSIHVAEFNNKPGSRGPFYAWSNNEVHNQIEQLFSGKKIYLFADVTRSDKRNAVKFSTIYIEFWSSNKTVNDQLSKIMEIFHISMTHMGESNYRCNNDFYTILSRPLTIEFSFDGKNNKPTDRNAVYDKLFTGYRLLSPYTLWAIQLKHGDFDRLKPYIDFVDIELHGFGQYLEENAPICENHLDKYYKLKNMPTN